MSRGEPLTSVRLEEERAILEAAIARMGWPEIDAFRAELRKGQDIYEDAGGFCMRAIRRLFGLPVQDKTVTNYQAAARALVLQAERSEAAPPTSMEIEK